MGGAAKVLTAPIKAVTGIFDTPKPPALPAPQQAATDGTAADDSSKTPTIDDARMKAEEEARNDKRRGRLSNYLTPTSTGSGLGGSTATASLKRMLGS